MMSGSEHFLQIKENKFYLLKTGLLNQTFLSYGLFAACHIPVTFLLLQSLKRSDQFK